MPPSPSSSSAQTLLPALTSALKSFTTSSPTSKFQILHRVPSQTSPQSTLSPTSPKISTLYILDSSFNPPTLAHFRIATSALRQNHNHNQNPRRTIASSSEDKNKQNKRNGIRLLLLLAIKNADKKPQPAALEQRLGMMVSFAEDIYGYIMKSGDDGNKLESRDKDGDGGFGREDGVGDGVVGIDIGVTTEPFFHDKARVIGESGEYVFDEEGDEEDGEESASQIYLLGYDSLLRLFSPEYYAQGNINSALAPFFESCAVRVTIREDDNNKKWGRKEEQVRFVEGLRDEWGLEGRIECVQGVERLEGGGDGGVSSTRVREMARDGDEVGVRGFCTRGVGEWVLGEGLYRD